MPPHLLLGDSPPPGATDPPRLGRWLSLSVGTHVAGALVLTFFATGRSSVPVSNARTSTDSQLVWLARAGPGGGGDGGGNRSPAPARAAHVRGPGRLAVPDSASASIVPARDPHERQVPRIVVPFQPATAGLDNLTGLLQPIGIGDPASRGSGFGDGVGSRDGSRMGVAAGPGSGDGAPGGGGIDWPRPIVQVKPQYTNDAMRAKLQGMVTLEALVLRDGTVGEVNVVRSLDSVFGLDEAALAAVKQWKFKPGTQLGRPIPVLVIIELTFTLR